MTYLPPYLAGSVDEHDAMDRRDQAREAEIEFAEGCSCNHAPEDHTPGNGCEWRWCTCQWWGPYCPGGET